MLVRTCPVKYGKGFSPACSPPCFLPPYRSVKWQGSLKVLGQNQGDISAAAALLFRLCFFFFSRIRSDYGQKIGKNKNLPFLHREN